MDPDSTLSFMSLRSNENEQDEGFSIMYVYHARHVLAIEQTSLTSLSIALTEEYSLHFHSPFCYCKVINHQCIPPRIFIVHLLCRSIAEAHHWCSQPSSQADYYIATSHGRLARDRHLRARHTKEPYGTTISSLNMLDLNKAPYASSADR